MSKFVDNKTYYIKLVSREKGVFINLTGEADLIPIDYETLNYYFNHYTFTKGHSMNGLKKVECNDGKIRYLGKEHEEYKEAEKKQEYL